MGLMGPIKRKHKLIRGTDEDVDVVDKSHGAGFWQPSQPSGVISGLPHFFPLHLLLIILMQYPSTYHPQASVQYSTPYCWALFSELFDQELHYGMFYGLDAATVLRPGEIGPPGHEQINCHDLKRYREIYFVQIYIPWTICKTKFRQIVLQKSDPLWQFTKMWSDMITCKEKPLVQYDILQKSNPV